MTVSGVTISATVISYAEGVTLGFAYAASSNDFGAWEPDVLALVDSLVINKPPVSQPSP